MNKIKIKEPTKIAELKAIFEKSGLDDGLHGPISFYKIGSDFYAYIMARNFIDDGRETKDKCEFKFDVKLGKFINTPRKD